MIRNKLRQYARETKDMKKKKTELIYHGMLAVLLVSALTILLVLSYWACKYSYYGSVNYKIHNMLIRDVSWKHIIVFLLASLGTMAVDQILNRQNKAVQEKICLAVLTITCVLIFSLGTFYVVKNPYYPVGDQINTTAFSAYCREGNFIMLCPGGYMGMHQHQKGLGFLYEILFSVFGDFNYTPAKIIHVLWWVLTVYAGCQYLKITMDRAVFRVVYCMIMLGCIPYLLFLPYIYGDILSISFCMVMFWAASAYEHFGQKRYLLLAGLVASIAILARKNTLIVLTAMVIYSILLCLKKRKLQCLMIGMIVVLTAGAALKTVDIVYEYRSGYPSGIGIPSILYVAMGLQDTDGVAGVYNRYHQTVFEENDFQQEPSAQVGKEYIRNRLQGFAEEPAAAIDFFKRKLEGQWIEPLFESLRATESFEEGAVMPTYIANLYYGKMYDVVWKLSNYYQSMMYLAGLAFTIAAGILWWRHREMPAALWLPLISIVGGFLFSIIWEAQCRYVFPYYVFLALYVPKGLLETGKMIQRLRIHNKEDQNSGKEKEEKLREIA